MGQWFRNLFEGQGLAVSLVGKTTRPDDMAQTIVHADIVLIAVPIATTQEVIESVIPHLKKDALLTDITSLKVMPMKAMQKANCARLGMHPLFGPSVVSTQGQKIVFCLPQAANNEPGKEHIDFLRKFFEDAGMEIIQMEADEHDKQMALIQALTHSSNILFAKTLAEQRTSLDPRLQTPIFRLQSLTKIRVLQQEPELMADIQLLNPYFMPVLESLLQQIQELFAINQTKNRKELLESLEDVHQQSQELAPYALRQTNKILQMVQEKPAPDLAKTKKVHKKHLTVAYLGPEGTNTHQAALLVGNTNELLAQANLDDVFAAVLSGKADIGVVPAENSLQGTIRETLDLLSDSPLQVIGSFDQPIHHCLLSLEKDLTKIKTVISHPQALAQCKHWLVANLPNAKQQPTASTTAALPNPKKGKAYIAAEEASKLYHAPVLARNIEDTQNNTTRFYVIAKSHFDIPTLHTTNTLLFVTVYNRVGILRDILEIFAKKDISLVKLESRPSLEKIWDYCFYIEVDQQAETKLMQQTFELLRQYCTIVRVLGRT